jgi:glycosyltransferase involved in cell wall biosynthesis
LKVLFVLPSKISITGASIAAINIIIGLLENNIEVYVIATKPPKEYEVFFTRLKEKGAKLFIESSEKKGYQYWKDLAKRAVIIVERFDIQIVHLHLPKLMYFIGNDLKKMNKKIIFTVEGDPIFEVKELGFLTRWRTKRMWKKSLSIADCVCPCSDWLKDIILKRDKVENIITVHNPIDIEKFENVKDIGLHEFNVNKNNFVVMTAARLTQVKDISTLLRGFALFIKNKEKKPILIILGDGELKKTLVDLAKKLDIENSVIFAGFKNNPQDYISSADIFVMTSNYEPFGMPAAEAGILGIPVIVSNTGGLAEIIIDKITGLQFESGNFHELSDCFTILYNNLDLRKKMGFESKKRVKENFSQNVIGDKFLKIYNSL